MTMFTDAAENELLDFYLRGQAYTPPATRYVGLLTVAPTDSAAGTEVTGGSYARVAVAASLANWSGTQGAGTTVASSGTSGTVSNNNTLTYPAPTANWGNVVAVGVYDALTGGVPKLYGTLTTPRTINSGDTASNFPAGTITIQLDN